MQTLGLFADDIVSANMCFELKHLLILLVSLYRPSPNQPIFPLDSTYNSYLYESFLRRRHMQYYWG